MNAMGARPGVPVERESRSASCPEPRCLCFINVSAERHVARLAIRFERRLGPFTSRTKRLSQT